VSDDDRVPSGKPTLVSMPLKPDQLAADSEKLARHADLLIEQQRVVARIRRAAYLAYLAEGFDEAQALQLCCK